MNLQTHLKAHTPTFADTSRGPFAGCSCGWGGHLRYEEDWAEHVAESWDEASHEIAVTLAKRLDQVKDIADQHAARYYGVEPARIEMAVTNLAEAVKAAAEGWPR